MDESVAILEGIDHRYARTRALADVSLAIPAGRMAGIIGPDGVGKSTLLGLVAGARKLQQGKLRVLGGDMRSRRFRAAASPRIAYMPQGLGGNLYPSLTVSENLAFFADLFGLKGRHKKDRIRQLLAATDLLNFIGRPAGKLSGGMKQKLALCCALIHNPDLLILDEPTTGVDPLSRRRFWELIDTIRTSRPRLSVLVATAYMEEAERFDWLAAMDGGRVLASGAPHELLTATNTENLDEAFIHLLPESRRDGARKGEIMPHRANGDGDRAVAIEARNLTLRFGDFKAVNDVSFSIERGEIFGFLGSNGCGKTTTMKMLTGLLEPSGGEVMLFGQPLDFHDRDARRRVGYMSQSFSLYGELSVRQNLDLHARLFDLPRTAIEARIGELARQFELDTMMDKVAAELPLGVRQRLSLAVALVHSPDLLILDEPTSGVDPLARDNFWRLLIALSREQGVTIFISTHFMNEGERCDRVSLMHAGRVLACDSPNRLTTQYQANALEEAFITVLEREDHTTGEPIEQSTLLATPEAARRGQSRIGFSFGRMLAYARREAKELIRDPIRLAFAFLGSALLMVILGYGITMDVEDLRFAVLDYDQTPQSRDYIAAVSGSRYFLEQVPIKDREALENRLRSGDISLAIEIPPRFGKDLKRGRDTAIAIWVDGAMPFRGETITGYVQGLHYTYLEDLMQHNAGNQVSLAPFEIEDRYRYNQDFRSLDAMVPAMIPLLLIFIPAILMALGIVREKELGSITNLYVTPVTRLEFLIGKQLPYIGFSMVSYFSLVGLALLVFRVPMAGSLLWLTIAALLYVTVTTAIGQVMSSFASTQIAALAGTAVLTMLPTTQFFGLTEPVSSLDGASALIGHFWPATWFLLISRGIFTKGLSPEDMRSAYLFLAAFIPVLILIAAALLRKQGR